MSKKSVLLVGNGINNINNKFAWQELLEELIDHIGARGQIYIRDKPFPLLYEEIIAEAVKNREFKEKEIKDFISKKISNLKKNSLHEEIMKLGFQNILTTNYDYNLEKAKQNDTTKLKNNGSIKERTYSLFRHTNVETTNIWHIHGECNSSSSITLGYEHYSGYLQQLRNYVVTGTGSTYKKIKYRSINERFEERKGKIEFNSWVDFFFKKDIYILGFTLDFVEIHLWWILTYRTRMMFEGKIPVSNRIRYFYPAKDADNIINRVDLLKSNAVTPFSIKLKGDNWEEYYLNALSKIP